MIEKKSNILENLNINQLDTLTKIRITIFSIFLLSTISFILIIFNVDFWIPALLILISYVILLILMIQLLIIKDL
jgi:hypothetical protein